MAFNATDLKDVQDGQTYTFVVTSAKVKATKSGYIQLSLPLRVAEGEATGYTLFHSVFLVHPDDDAETQGYMRRAVQDIGKILGYAPDILPTEVGEETEVTQALPGAAFEATVKFSPGKNGYPDSFRLGRILGPVTLSVNKFDSDEPPF